MPMLANAAFYYRSPQEIYLENFNLIDVEIDGSEQLSPSYDVGAKGTYLQYFRQCMFLRCNVHDTGATGIGNDYPGPIFCSGLPRRITADAWHLTAAAVLPESGSAWCHAGRALDCGAYH
ncbi:Uncharacterised protein [Klebsiella pneumoniae]|nr:Uncharacterised protein [Klebsiella pneumoniae]